WFRYYCFFQAEDGIRDFHVTGVQTCALPIFEILEPGGAPAGGVIYAPVVGRVTAGEPILAVENIEGYFPLAREFAGAGELFLLQVRGDSMIKAGILDGDYVIVRQQPDAVNGDIVVALL